MTEEILPFTLIMPENWNGIIVSSPHSGDYYPKDFLAKSKLDLNELRKFEDFQTNKIINGISKFGYALINANYARALIDLNRAPDSLDKILIENIPPFYKTTIVNNGFGIIPRLINNNVAIHNKKIDYKDAQKLISEIYNPYHDKIKSLIEEAKLEFNKSIILDIHSMPDISFNDKRLDIIIGSRFGNSAKTSIIKKAETLFKNYGFNVGSNYPYAGGYITQKYGKPRENQNCLQIEINRALYMDEKNLKLRDDFKDFKAIFENFFKEFIED